MRQSIGWALFGGTLLMGAITIHEIEDGSITTAKLADGAVTQAKLSALASAKLDSTGSGGTASTWRSVTLTAGDFDPFYSNPGDNNDGAQVLRNGTVATKYVKMLVLEHDGLNEESAHAAFPAFRSWDGDTVIVTFSLYRSAAVDDGDTAVFSIRTLSLDPGDYFHAASDTTPAKAVPIPDIETQSARMMTYVDTLVTPWTSGDDTFILGLKRLQADASDNAQSDLFLVGARIDYREAG